MLIDFHVHAFNEKIAAKAIAGLEATVHQKALTNGTIPETLQKMDEWGVDHAVILSIATKPSQQTVINDWAAELQKNSRLIPFGSVHPDAPDVYDELERISALGIKGIKLHPDYQHFEVDEPRLFPIYQKAAELGLVVVFHAGLDAVSPEYIHCVPEAAARAHKAVPEMTMVLAHVGGYRLWEDVYKHLAGLDGELYFDLSFHNECPDELFRALIEKHGARRFLMASDCPWGEIRTGVARIQALELPEADKELIFHGNAERLLGL